MSVIGARKEGESYTCISLSSGGVDEIIQDKLRAGWRYHVSATQEEVWYLMLAKI